MEIYTIPVGLNATNCYIVEFERNKIFIIDPGAEGEKILAFLQEKGLTANGIILTHGHFDHIGAVAYLRKALGLKVAIHEYDSSFLSDEKKNLSYMLGKKIVVKAPDEQVHDGDVYNDFRIFSTPGHTPGGISLYSENEGILFSGDTIFRNGYGRTDFPNADQETLIHSINKLLKLPDDTLVYPGHGSTTTIAEFRRYIG